MSHFSATMPKGASRVFRTSTVVLASLGILVLVNVSIVLGYPEFRWTNLAGVAVSTMVLLNYLAFFYANRANAMIVLKCIASVGTILGFVFAVACWIGASGELEAQKANLAAVEARDGR